MNEKQEKLFNDWLKSNNQTDRGGIAKKVWEACLDANGINENCTVGINCRCSDIPFFPLSGVPEELKKLTLEELLIGKAWKVMNKQIFHGTHDPKNWKPKQYEIVLVKTYTDNYMPPFSKPMTISHIDGERVYFFDQTGLQRFISTDIKNVKPFAASKIGKSWDEI